jgi:NADPH:quinone reductase-like Zn-dependent oxidoreductase
MRAVGYFAPGPITAPDSLVDIELPRPSAIARDLLVEVRAISVNPVDYKVRSTAAPPAGAANVIGYDAAGVVVEAGPQASLFRPDDEVFYAGSVVRSGTNAESSGVSRARSGLPRPRLYRSRRSPRGKPCLIAWISVSRWRARPPRCSSSAALAASARWQSSSSARLPTSL